MELVTHSLPHWEASRLCGARQGTSGPSAHRGSWAKHPVDTGCGEPHVGKEGQLEILFSLFFAVKIIGNFHLKIINKQRKHESI